MFFDKQKKELEETKKEVKEELDDICKNGRVLAIGVLTGAALLTGFLAGSISTALVTRRVNSYERY